MNTLRHVCEPSKLLLTWQGLESSQDPQMRTRRVVAELIPELGGVAARMRYLVGTPDYEAAVAQGFQGYPAFRLPKSGDDESVTVADAMPALMRRLPPRKREDFSEYLKRHSLPSPFENSDFALLGYTAAKLPSDGFGLVPLFSSDDQSCEIVTELAGTRYHATQDQLKSIDVGDEVKFIWEPHNQHDKGAIRAEVRGMSIGYVNRVMSENVHQWMRNKLVSATVLRKNGTAERPLIYVRVAAHPR